MHHLRSLFADLGIKRTCVKHAYACCTHLVHCCGSKIECRHPIDKNGLLSVGDRCGVGFRLEFNLIKGLLKENDSTTGQATELTLLSLLEEEVRRLDWTITRRLKARNCSDLVASAIACCLFSAAVKFHPPTPEASTLQEPSISPTMLMTMIRNILPIHS